MGYVVAARHLQLDQLVAMKFLRRGNAGLDETEATGRFLREAKAVVRLRDEHVAKVFDVGTLESGEPYIVMEYLDGCDLAALAKQRGQLPVSEAVEYVLQACEALAEAHALGIVHRDVKLANLFVTRGHAGSPLVKVLDFGISKVESVRRGRGGARDDAHVVDARQPALHVARADARPAHGRRTKRHLVARRRALSPRRGQAAVRGRDARSPALDGHAREPGARSRRAGTISRRASTRSSHHCLEKDPNVRFANVAELAYALVAVRGRPGARARRRRSHRADAQRRADASHARDAAASATGPFGRRDDPDHASGPGLEPARRERHRHRGAVGRHAGRSRASTRRGWASSGRPVALARDARRRRRLREGAATTRATARAAPRAAHGACPRTALACRRLPRRPRRPPPPDAPVAAGAAADVAARRSSPRPSPRRRRRRRRRETPRRAAPPRRPRTQAGVRRPAATRPARRRSRLPRPALRSTAGRNPVDSRRLTRLFYEECSLRARASPLVLTGAALLSAAAGDARAPSRTKAARPRRSRSSRKRAS